MADPAAADRSARDRESPVFVYSGFRASSTWLWSKFRAHEGMLCYYEPFNEQLGSLTLDNIGQARPDNWRSHHPDGAPYVLEYAGMLGEGVGVRGFPAIRDLGERYTGAAGPEGPLDDDIAAYVQGLIDHAHKRGRVPLLACTRLLGRARGLKVAFGGYHILLIRNLFQQWNSYAGQARFGNWYFLQTLFETLGMARCDPVIARLAQLFPREVCTSLEAWITPGNFDKVFCYFVGFHLYFLTLARRTADLVIDVNALAGSDPQYREGIVARIARDIGVELDLEDVHERVDFPLHPVAEREACIILIDEIAATLTTLCAMNADERRFVDGLVADIWREQELFQRQTAGAVEYLAEVREQAEARMLDVRQDAARQVQEAVAQRDESVQALDALCRELAHKDEEHGRELADLNACLAAGQASLAAVQAELADLRESQARSLDAAGQALDERAGQLASANQELVTTCDALDQVRDALTQALHDLEAERASGARRDTEIVASMTETGLLRDALARSRAAAAGLGARLHQLERGIANVDATNIELAGRLRRAEQVGRDMKRRFAGERLGDGLASAPDYSVACLRVDMMLDALSAHRLTLALLPEPLWRRRLRARLAAIPGFEVVGRDAAPDRLAEAIWTALIRRA